MNKKQVDNLPAFVIGLQPVEIKAKIVLINNKLQKLDEQMSNLKSEMERFESRITMYYDRYKELTGTDLRPVPEVIIVEEEKSKEGYYFSNLI